MPNEDYDFSFNESCVMRIFTLLNRQQKEAVGLLQIGTFLEYFDLMLYVHMAVLLNELFFPKTDPHTTALLAALAFCSTFVLRPFGALLFGYIGDHIGRRSTVIITTMMMSISCLAMATLPTYAQIGITASWVVTICRMLQGLSSMGEIMGAQIYITEITKPPAQYVAVSLIVLSSTLGGVAALGLASFVTHVSMDWRLGFWAGAAIAVVGSLARTTLRETPEFVDMKRKKQIEIDRACINNKKKKVSLEKLEKEVSQSVIPLKTFMASFFIECPPPFIFYLVFIYFNPLLQSFGYSTSDIIYHNFILSFIYPIYIGIIIFLVTRVHPLKILRFKSWYFFSLMLILPFAITYATSNKHIFLLQAFLMICQGVTPAGAILIKWFPVCRRFTVTTLIYALTRACVHVITSFGLIYLTKWMGYWGIWIIAFPAIIGLLWGVRYFEKLEGLRGVVATNNFSGKNQVPVHL